MEFSVPDLKTVGSKEIKLSQLPEQEEYDKVTVAAQVFKVNKPQTFGAGKIKQNITLADATGTATLTLWEGDMLLQNKSYQTNRLVVRSYNIYQFLQLVQQSTSRIAPSHQVIMKNFTRLSLL